MLLQIKSESETQDKDHFMWFQKVSKSRIQDQDSNLANIHIRFKTSFKISQKSSDNELPLMFVI